MTIIATAGSATANCYITIADADTYFAESRYHSEDWTALSDTVKEQVLRWSTRLIDQFDFVGTRSDPLGVDQRLDWPRSFVPDADTGLYIDSTTIPFFIAEATAEYALFLYREDRTGAAQEDLAQFNKIKVDVIELGIENITGKKNVVPSSVLAMLRPYFADSAPSSFAKKLWRT